MLDKKVAIIGCACGIVLLLCAITIGKGIGLSFTLFFSCLVYLIIIRWKDIDVRTTFHSYTLSRSKLCAIHITNIFCLILFFVVSVYFIYYFRPLEYFLFASIFSAIIGLEILTFPEEGSRFFLGSILLQILLLATSLRWGVIFEFPGLIGSDWYHSLLTEYIIKNGHAISPLYQMAWTPLQVSEYGSFPFMHLTVSMTSLITSISSYKLSLVSSMGIFEIASLLFVFLITIRILADVRLALFATLFLGVSNWHIVYGFSLLPQSLGYGLFALMIYLLVKQTLKPTHSNFLLIILTLFSIIFSHTLTSFVLVITILVFFLSKRFYSYFVKNISRTQQMIGVTLPVTLFSGISVLVYWIFYTDSFTKRVFSLKWNLTTRMGVASPAFKSYFHYEFDQLGIYLLYVLAIIGFLVWLKKGKSSLLKITIIASTSTLSFFMYGSWLFGLSSILPERWFLFIFILIAVPAAEGLKNLVKTVKRKNMLILTTLLIFSLTFLMITTGDANRDSPLFKKEEVGGASYLESEMCAAETINGFFNGAVYADQGFADYFWWVLRRNMTSINFIAFKLPIEGIVIERNYIYERPTPLEPFGPLIRVNRTFEYTLQNMNKVYCNGEVAAYTPIWNASK